MNAFLYLVTVALFQNFVLTTGFGSSLSVRLSRRPATALSFGGLLTVFSVVAVLITYPLDAAIGNSATAKLLRPLLIVAVVSVVYAVFYGALKSIRHPAAVNLLKMLPTAAFNNMTVGVLLIVNHQFALPLGSAMMLSIGAALGFTLLTLMVGYLRSRLDHPSIPVAFRGLPILLISLGLLALGLMGFASSIALI